MSVSIFTITHVPFTPPDDATYIPLQVGCATHPDYGYLRDDTGDHISEKNPYYSELTGLYWIWKNCAQADYIGLCHYRRYFLNEAGMLMNEAEYLNILSRYDVMVSQAQSGPYDYQTVYGRSHDIHNLYQTGEVIRELYPDYYHTFQEVLSDNHCYAGNLFVAPRALFSAYCEWLFSIFFTLEQRINADQYDDYHKRVFGFLSEQLLIVWIKHNHFSFYETPFGLSQEKAETIALKDLLRKDFAARNIDAAYRHLNDTLAKRPDLLLDLSDFQQDLRIIEHIINICRTEAEEGASSFLNFSCDMTLLIRHFRLLLTILEHIRDASAAEEELRYLTDCRISCKALVYMLQNFPQLADNPLEMLNRLALIYSSARQSLTALSFLQEALTLQENNKITLSNIVTVLQAMGQPEMAAEYQQLLQTIEASDRYVIFTGSGIPILDYIAGQYTQALETLGHTVLLFDKQDFEASMDKLFTFQKEGLDGAIVFNNACFQMRLQSGESLWDVWKVPCYNVLVDHPMYYFDTLDHAPVYGVVACADKYHTDYIRRFYPTVQQTLFLPTAGECLKPYEELKPFRERTIDVLFIGSYKYHEDVVYDAFDRQLEAELLSHPYKTFEQAVTDCLSQNNQSLSDDALKLLIQQHRYTDVNTTACFRRGVIETLLNAGISVTVYGNGWQDLELFRHPNFLYKGLISPEDGIALMEESKIVLNHMAWFKAGASERIFEAMLQGAISLTDDSEYLREHFTDSKDIKFYSLSHIEELPQMVHELLSDPVLSDTIRRSAYKQAIQNHTWIKRIQKMLDTEK